VQLTSVDWLVVALYFLFNLAIGFYYKSRAGKNVTEFFLSGRNVPWWLAGTSMVATTFAADTPLAVTGLVYKYGISGNWLWWSLLLSGMMTVFLFARLWRRSGLLTDAQFAEIRYSGRPAAFLRGFRAIYLSGAGVANASYGLPDLGITSCNDVCEDVRRISAATELPLLVDADTGWGGAFNIARTTTQLIRAGAAGDGLIS